MGSTRNPVKLYTIICIFKLKITFVNVYIKCVFLYISRSGRREANIHLCHPISSLRWNGSNPMVDEDNISQSSQTPTAEGWISYHTIPVHQFWINNLYEFIVFLNKNFLHIIQLMVPFKNIYKKFNKWNLYQYKQRFINLNPCQLYIHLQSSMSTRSHQVGVLKII